MSSAENNADQTELQRLLVEAINGFVAESPFNSLKDIDGSPIMEDPLLGFAAGDDPLFAQYKTAVGEYHLTPQEMLEIHLKAATGLEQPEVPRGSVVSWILPLAKKTKLTNREMSDGPSQRWNHSRYQGQDFLGHVTRFVVSWLQERGQLAFAPGQVESLKPYRQPDILMPIWSERHAAHAAGLGTFGLNGVLITPRGSAHYCGSVLTSAEFVPTSRDYSHHYEYCPYLQDGSCGVCIERCPGGAIGPNGRDRDKCRKAIGIMRAAWQSKPGYMGDYAGCCGLCMTKVPCESRVPRKTGVKRAPKLAGAANILAKVEDPSITASY